MEKLFDSDISKVGIKMYVLISVKVFSVSNVNMTL